MKRETLLILFLCLIFIGQGFGQPLLTEDFDYTSGTALTANGWTAHSGGTTNPILVSSTGLTYSGYANSGVGLAASIAQVSGQDVNHTFTAITSGSAYVAAMVNVSAAQTGDYFFHLGTGTSTFNARLYIKTTTGGFLFGLSKATETVVYTSSAYSLNTTYLVVLKYTFVSGSLNDIVDLFVNPTPGGVEPTPTIHTVTTSGTDATTLTAVFLRQGTAGSMPTVKVDGIRVATTWADAVAASVSATATLAQLTTGVASSPLTASSSNKALLGYSLTANGAMSYTAVTVPFSVDPSTRFLNAKLYTSTDNDYGTSGDNSVVASSGTISSTGISFSFTAESLPASTTKNYFVVADVAGGVDGTTAATQPSLSEANFTTASGTVATNTITGTSYSFAVATSPTIVVASTMTSFGAVAVGSSSAEQSYTVSGTSLTNDIVINAPTDFQVSTTSGSGFGSTVTLTQVSGSVAVTPVYVRFHPTGSTGTVTQNIDNTTVGGTTISTSVTGIQLAVEPATQSAITFGSVDNNSIVVNFAGGSGTNHVVVAHAGTAVSFAPTDAVALSGVNSLFTSATDQGSGNKVVYDGTGSTVTVTGLVNGTTYHFAVYDYNLGTNNSENYNVTSPGINNTPTTNVVTTYTWNGATTDYQAASNWTPARPNQSTNDVLLFSTGGAVSVTNVPTQTVGQLILSNNTAVTLQAAAASTIVTISGGEGTDLDVPSGSALNITGTNSLKLMVGTGANAVIGGTMAFTSGAHSMDAADAAVVGSAGIVFQSGSSLTQGTGTSGNVFTSLGTASSVIFVSGATFIQMSGSNPFALSQPSSKVVFQTGSNFSLQANLIPSFSGRTYPNFELNFASASFSVSGAAGVTIDNLTITAGTLNFGMTTATHNIKGNISVAAGATLNFAPASAGTLNFTGTTAQSITNLGTLTTNSAQTFVINNAAGVSLGSDLTINGTLTLTNGLLTTGAHTLHFGATATDPAGVSASRIVGNASMDSRAVGTGTLSFLGANITGSTDIGNVVITRVTGTHQTGSSNQSINAYWDITASGTAPFDTRSLALTWLSDYDNSKVFSASNLGQVYVSTNSGTDWTAVGAAYDMTGTTSHTTAANAVTAFGRFTVSDATSPLMIPATVISVTLLPEGYASNYATNAAFPTEVFTIHVANATSPFADVESHTATINPSTLVGSASFTALTSGTYYIYITHVNTIETWSKDGGEAIVAGSPVNYDFTSAQTQAYGSKLKLISGKYCLYSGDVDETGYIDNNDLLLIDNDAFAFKSGTVKTDLDGTQYVDNNDLLICDNNAFNFIGKSSPRPAKKAIAAPNTVRPTMIQAKNTNE